MALSILSASDATIPNLIEILNDQLAVQLSKAIVYAGFIGIDQVRSSVLELSTWVVIDDGVASTSPFKIEIFEGATFADAQIAAQGFINSNPTFFFGTPIFSKLDTTRRTKRNIVIVFYNESFTDGLNNWIPLGSTGTFSGATLGLDLAGHPTMVVGIEGVPISGPPISDGSVMIYNMQTNMLTFGQPVRYFMSSAAATAAAPFINNTFIVISPGVPPAEAGTYQVTSNGGVSFPADYTLVSTGVVVAADVGITDAGGYYSGSNVESALQQVGATLYTPVTANFVFAGPTAGPAALPDYRLLVVADIPNLPASIITSGLLSPAIGGTGVDGSAAPNGSLLIGNGTGYSLNTLTGSANRLTVTNGVGSITLDISAAYVGQTSITTLGTITTGTWNATIISPQYGGTGINAAAAANGQLLIGNGAGFSLNTLTGTANRLSVTNGVGTITLDISATYVGQTSITTLGTITTGTWNATIISPQYGGTGVNAAAAANGQLLIGNGAGFSLNTLTGTANRLTVTNGVGSITLDIAATYIGQTSITTLGTVTTGTWQATLISAQFGGTGVNGAAAANGTLLIGNGAGYTLATLTGTANRLSVSNGAGSITLDISATYVGQTSITTLGTVTTGTWQATTITAQFGGTGVNGAAAPNGSLLIGNGAGYTLATLTAVANRTSITNGVGSITIDISATYVGQTTITTLGTITTGVWNATIVGTTYGGTGINGSAAANGTLLIGNSAGYTLATLTAGSNVTITNGAGSITIALSATYTGSTSIVTVGTITTGTWNASVITVPFGGTGVATLAAHGVLIGNGTGTVTVSATGTSGQVLASNGAAADPTYQSLSALATIGGIIVWGNNSINAGADTRYLFPGYNPTVAASTVEESPVLMTRSGTLKNLVVAHNVAIGNGNSVVYTVMKNSVATSITVTIATNAITTASDTTNSVSVVITDKISIRASKAASIGNGAQDIMASLELV